MRGRTPVCSQNRTRRPSWSLVPIVDPATDSWVKKIRVSSAGGTSPLVAPQITIRADDEAAQIDPVLMRQAVRNLLDNAFRHAPGTPVNRRAATIDHHVTLCVSDAGRGLPEHQRGRLSRTETGAGGLGLSIVAAIADAHGGYAEAGVESDGGTRITIVVPNETNDAGPHCPSAARVPPHDHDCAQASPRAPR